MKRFLQPATVLSVCISICTLLCPGLSQGDMSMDETVLKLEEVVVTATRTEENVRDVPVPVQIITTEEIEESGATNVGDLIGKYVTGHYHKYSGLQAPIGLRGFMTDAHGDDIKGHVLMLVDGHRIGTGNMAKIPLDLVERIEIIKGPASALYGSAAMGGVLNIITKKGKGKIKTTLKQELGSFDYEKSSLSSGGMGDDKFAYHIAASYESAGNYSDPKYGEVYNSDQLNKNIAGNVSCFLNENHDLRVGGSYADLTGGYPRWKDFKAYSSYDKNNHDEYDKSHGYGDLEYNGRFLEEKIHWKALGYYLWDRNQWFTGYPDPDTDYTKYTDTTWGTDQQFTLKLVPGNKLVAGFTYEDLKKKSEGRSGGAPSRPYTPSMDYETKSVYAQDSIDLLDNRLNIVVGARYDRFDVATRRPETGAFDSFNERTVDFDNVSPKAGVVVKLFDDLLRFRGNAGQGFKAPSADEMSAMYEHPGWYGPRRILGNPDLKPEKTTTYEAGFDISHDRVDFGVSFFHTDYKDKIEKAPETVTYDGKEWETWENLGKAEIEGFDINLNWRIDRTFDLQPALILYCNSTFNTKRDDKENNCDLKCVSDYEIKSGLRFGHEQTTASLSYVLIGPQKVTNWDDWANPKTETKGSFSFWDLTMTQGLFGNWKLEASIMNLFNEEYEWARGYPMPERTFTIGLSYTFT